MNLSDPYLLRLLIDENHERRLSEAEEERLAGSINGSVPRHRRRPHLSISLSLEPRHHARRPHPSA